MKSLSNPFRSIILFYYDGFRNMPSWGRKAWLIIIIKLFLIYAIFRIFFFQGSLDRKYNNDTQRSEYVRNQILNSQTKND